MNHLTFSKMISSLMFKDQSQYFQISITKQIKYVNIIINCDQLDLNSTGICFPVIICDSIPIFFSFNPTFYFLRDN